MHCIASSSGSAGYIYIYIYIYIGYLYFVPWVWNSYSIPEPPFEPDQRPVMQPCSTDFPQVYSLLFYPSNQIVGHQARHPFQFHLPVRPTPMSPRLVRIRPPPELGHRHTGPRCSLLHPAPVSNRIATVRERLHRARTIAAPRPADCRPCREASQVNSGTRYLDCLIACAPRLPVVASNAVSFSQPNPSTGA
jgi:hypothetical protein